MKLELIAYAVGALAVSYMLMCWFLTGFSVRIASVLDAFGLLKNYNMDDIATKEDLDDYMQGQYGFTMWLELLCCPYCLSFHLSYLTAIAIWAVTSISWWFIPAAAISWPAISNILFHYVSTTSNTQVK